MKTFRIAPMSMVFRAITLVLLALPLLFLVRAMLGSPVWVTTSIFLVAIYSWVWLRFRPTHFVVQQDGLEVVWPLKRRRIPRASISGLRLVNRRDLDLGWAVRVGAGGLWGGFGWLWTEKRGIVQMYISRFNDLIWFECAGGRPWLISPERPEDFIQALSNSPAQPAVPVQC